MPHTDRIAYRSFVTDPILREIGTERLRQIDIGRTPLTDDEYNSNEDMALGAMYFTVPAAHRRNYPRELLPTWSLEGWSPDVSDNSYIGRITQLRKAAALIVAEIERLQRNIKDEQLA